MTQPPKASLSHNAGNFGSIRSFKNSLLLHWGSYQAAWCLSLSADITDEACDRSYLTKFQSGVVTRRSCSESAQNRHPFNNADWTAYVVQGIYLRFLASWTDLHCSLHEESSLKTSKISWPFQPQQIPRDEGLPRPSSSLHFNFKKLIPSTLFRSPYFFKKY